VQHLLCTCSFARQFWHAILFPLSLGALIPAVDEISFVEWWRKVLKKVHKNRKKGFNSLIILGSWCLWLTRNKVVSAPAMCFPAPTLPSLPGAPPSPPHSPTSVPTPGPAAIPSSPLAPETASTPLAAGRSKALRWRDDGSPAFSPVVSPGLHRRRPSYKEALLLPRAAPCLGREVDNGAGWVKVEGRQARRRRLRPLKSPPLLPRVVPSDLRGKCFNCLSSSHRAVVCRRLVRCFCCQLPRHRAYVCPHRRSGVPQPRRGLMWRPVSQSSGMAGSGDNSAGGVEVGGDDGDGRLKKRTRRGQRRRSGTQRDSEDQEAAVEVPAQHCAEQGLDHATGRPKQIIKYSRRILQEEDYLRRALIITVIDQTNSGCAADVSEALAVRFNLYAQTLDLRRAAPNSYVAFLPNEIACRVLNGGMPFVSPTVRLHIKRWSRQAMAVGGRALPVPVDIELRGIPAHLWGLETASHLLDEHCLIRDVHPAFAEGVDLSVFKLSAWCDEPELVPAELDLLAEEPQLRAFDFGPSPRTLVFPISVRVFRSDGILDSSPLPPPPPPYSGDDREQDHDKRRKNPHSSPTVTVRRPVHARLEPSARAGSARLGPCVRADSAPDGTVALPVPLGEESAASKSLPLARGSASGRASATVEFPGASEAEDIVGTGVDASGSPIPTFIPSVSPEPEPVPIPPGPASLIDPPHDAAFQTTVMEEFGGCHRIGQNSDSLCIVHLDRASVSNMQDPRVPIANAAQVRDPWEII
jgi:hypothetical protein